MQRRITRGAAAGAGLIFHIFAQDSTSTSGAGKASVAFGSWSCRYIRNGEAISGAITPEDITTIGTYAAPTANTNIRIKAVDNTNMIGIYEVQIHADWVNTTNSCQSLTIYLTASGVAVLPIQIPLEAVNPQDSVRMGLTSLPNAAAEAAGGLFTRGTGAGQINQAANGMIDTNPVRLNNVSQSLLDLKDFADDGYDPSTNKVQGVVLTDTVTTYTGNTPQTGDTFARLGAPAGASVSADIAAIEAQTDDIGTAGAGLTAIPWNAAWDAEVQSEVADALAVYDAPTKAELDAAVAPLALEATLGTPAGASLAADIAVIESQTDDIGTAGAGLTNVPWNAAWDAEVQSEATDALNAYDPPTKAELDAAVDALPTAGENADAVWEEAIADHSGTVGSTAEALGAAGAAGDPWATALPGAYGAGTAGKIIGDNVNATIGSRATQASIDTVDDFLDTEIADIRNRLPAALVSGRMDASVGAMATDVLTAAALNADAVTEIQSGLSTLNAAGVRSAVGLASANLDTQLTAIKSDTAAILADTAELQTDWVDGGRLDLILDARASQSSVNTIDDLLDTEVAAIKTDTDSIKNTLNAITITLASDMPSAAEIADKLLGRNLAGGADGGRTVTSALRPLRNKVDAQSVPGFLLVMEEDDSTESWRAAFTTSASAEPIVTVDPT